jgi:hypothetical protein
VANLWTKFAAHRSEALIANGKEVLESAPNESFDIWDQVKRAKAAREASGLCLSEL